jgi:hypothetical protein
VDQGPTPTLGAARGWPAPWGGAARGWPAPWGGAAALLLPSVSDLDSVTLRKNRNFGFCFVNSENISRVVFLKHKNSRKQGTDTVVSR